MEKSKKDRQKSKDKEKEKKEAKKERKSSKPKDKEKIKKEKNEESKVKRAKSAYLFFCGDKREQITKENPDKKAKDILKLLGDAWSKLSDADKKKYQEMADKDKERYQRECKEKGIEHKKGKKKAAKSEKIKI